ncbi:hypothetical protein Tco_1023662 [Tanacetum coccineum]
MGKGAAVVRRLRGWGSSGEDGDDVVAWFDGGDDEGVVAVVSWSGSQGGGAAKMMLWWVRWMWRGVVLRWRTQRWLAGIWPEKVGRRRNKIMEGGEYICVC